MIVVLPVWAGRQPLNLETNMHNPRTPAAHMMPSVGALMDPTYLRCAVADAADRARASRSPLRSVPSLVWEIPMLRVRSLLTRLLARSR